MLSQAFCCRWEARVGQRARHLNTGLWQKDGGERYSTPAVHKTDRCLLGTIVCGGKDLRILVDIHDGGVCADH